MSYCRLTATERQTISQMLARNESTPFIARLLGRSVSTVTREIARHSPPFGPYSAFGADRQAAVNASLRHRRCKIPSTPGLEGEVIRLLHLRWSPEQIARTLRSTYPDTPAMHVSHETIYTYIYVKAKKTLRQELLVHLRLHRKRRLKRGTARDRRGTIPEMISIDERPPEVDARTIPGHWEGDLIMGKDHKSAIATLVERTTRFVILVPLPSYDATTVRKAYIREIRSLPEQLRQSLTVDRGRENTQHALFTKETKMKVYFAHPYSPWQRGTNENTNRLVRDFFPKKTDFSTVTKKDLKHVQRLLNERPRKTLDWKTPAAVFDDLLYNYQSPSVVALET